MLSRNYMLSCEHPDCRKQAAACCDECDKYFCSEHGTVGDEGKAGVDINTGYPSVCWDCEGHSADGEVAAANA